MKYKYKINLEWSDDDQAWLATVPELPGCMADGPTPAEALAEAEVVIEEWLEEAARINHPIPAPLPTIDHVITASPYLNTAALARAIGVAPRTFTARLANRTPLKKEEAEKLRASLAKHNLALM